MTPPNTSASGTGVVLLAGVHCTAKRGTNRRRRHERRGHCGTRNRGWRGKTWTIEQAKWIAEYRNYWWQHVRKTNSNTAINSPTITGGASYFKKSDTISDSPASDGGNNFGRIARTGVMKEYLDRTLDEQLCGIPVRAWIDFFLIFAGGSSDQQEMANTLDQLTEMYQKSKDANPNETAVAIIETLRKLATASDTED